MKITIVMGTPDMSGGAKVIALYAQRLKGRGHDVCVISAGARPPTLRQRARELVRKRRWLAAPRSLPTYLDGTDVEHRVLERYRAVTDADVPDADVVVATWWQTAAWVAGLSPSKGAKAYFMQDYGAPGMELEDLIPTWKLPMHIITIAEWLVKLVEEHGGRTPISLVPNSVETEYFFAPARGKQPTPTVGFCYREVLVKGHDIVLEAFERARRSVPQLGLILYGWDPPQAELPDGVDFRFRPATDELRHVYAACDAWLFASRREGFGLPLLEAMACRTPVIATPAGAAPDIVAQGGGVLVAPDSPEAMAEAIVRFAEMPEAEWREFSDRAHATIEGYTWEDATQGFEAALEKAIELADDAAG